MPFQLIITKRKEAFVSVTWGEYIRLCRQRVPERGQAGGRKLREESDIIPIIF